MRIPIPRTGRRRRPPPERTAPPNRSVRSCRWSSSAKGVLDPNDAVRAVGHPFHREHIESHRMAAPRCLPLQEELSGTNDFALLAPGDRGKRSTEIDLSALPHLDDGKHAAVEAHEVELADFAAQVAFEDHETLRLKVRPCKLLRCLAALQAGFGALG